MLSLVLMALAAPAAGPSAPPTRTAACRMPGITYTGNARPVTGPRNLADQPHARHYLAVARHVGGCPEPAIVRSGIGAR